MASRFLAPFGMGRGVAGRGDPFGELNREINRLFDDVMRGPVNTMNMMQVPRMDVHETKDGLEVTAEMPGVTQNDIDLRVEGDLLTIRGEKRNERQDAQAHLMERSYGSFQRSVQLPFAPDPDRVQAEFRDGVLSIHLPKSAEQDRSRRIEIRGGEQAGGAAQFTRAGEQSAIGGKAWREEGESGQRASGGQAQPAEPAGQTDGRNAQ